MRSWKYFLSIVLIVIFVVWKIFLGNQNESMVLGLVSPTVAITPTIELELSPSATIIPIASPSATPTASPSATIILKLTPTPTKIKPTPTPTSTSSEEVNEFIDRFAAQYGVDKNVLRHIAICESGFKSGATNGPYAGLYQFGSTTWQNIRKEIGEDTNPDLRYAAKDAVQTAAYAVSKGKGGMWPNCFP